MSYDFESNSLIDIIIFSGSDVNYEVQKPRELIGEAGNKALANLAASYQNYKKNLNLDYEQFYNKVRMHQKELQKPEMPAQYRRSVVEKLTELANNRIINVENHYSWIHKIFHRITQAFKGHGFKTKGELGLKLAETIQQVEEGIYKIKLKQAIFHGSGLALYEEMPTSIINEMKERINNLSETEFKKVLNDVIFVQSEKVTLGEKNKYLFFKNLNEEKKKLFYQELLARKDWFFQAFDIIEGAEDEKFDPFITTDMVAKFQENSAKIISEYKKFKDKTGWFERYFYIFVEKSIQNYLENNDYQKIVNLLSDHPLIRSRIFSDPKILSKSEIQKLQENIRF